MTTVNYPNPGTDPTVRVFDDFYQRELVIDQNAYDSVYSFFASIFASKEYKRIAELQLKIYSMNLLIKVLYKLLLL